MAKSPVAILFDSNGVAMAVEDGVAIPVGTQALLAAGTDGTNAQILSVDSSGRLIAVGAGTAGTPAGGVVSIQGVAGGTAIPVTGTFNNASVGLTGSAVPTSASQIGGSDGTNLQAARIFDADSGAGSQYVLGTILRKSASGGSVEAGTSSDPLRIDPTGTTTQPISAASLPLPTGAATEATLSTRLADSTFTGRINTLGQKTAANSTPVVLASDQSALPITDNSGSLTVDTAQLPAALVGGRLDSNTGAWLGSTAPTVGSKTSANSIPVVIASDQGAVAVTGTVTATNPSVGSNNAALPTSSTEIGGSDGTNLQAIRVFDADSGAGTQYVLGAILRKSASGGSVEAGTATDPLRIDPTGTTTQPISAASLPLPTGAATETTLSTRLGDSTFTGRINTLGQKTSANSTPVVLSSDQSAIPVTDNAGSLTIDTTQLPAALVGSRLDINNGAWLGSTAPTVGQKTSANSIPVVLSSDQTALPVSVSGTHANAWNAAATGVNGNSTAIDCQYTPFITVFGTSSGGTTLSIQVSQNNTNFYTVATIGAGTGDFGGNYTIGARYVRLQSSNNRTITATIAGKD